MEVPGTQGEEAEAKVVGRHQERLVGERTDTGGSARLG